MNVTCDWSGRLGNNMFQAATVLAYALKYNVTPVFQKHEYLKVNDKSMAIENLYHEPYHAYKEIPYYNNVCLVGYYQSELYFKEVEDLIRKCFVKNKYPVNEYVAIHVRRGDYLQYPDKHPIPDMQKYYARAVCMFPLQKKLIFSDDKEYCKDVFKSYNIDGNDFIFSWELYPNLNDYEYLQLMASCSDFIIANSSYSWWGAWLSDNPNKKVICPSYNNWFGEGNKHLYPNDIIPEDWAQIKY